MLGFNFICINKYGFSMSAGDRVLVPDIYNMNSDVLADILTSDGTHYVTN